MKSLSSYTDQAITDLFATNGAFFAFSDKQFNEGRKDGVKYAGIGFGLICPIENAKAVNDGLTSITKLGIEQDMQENAVKDIIWRELANYECQIVGEPDDAIEALASYPISEQEIRDQWDGYWAHCVENDFF